MVGWPPTLDAHVGDGALCGGDRLSLNARMVVLLAYARVFQVAAQLLVRRGSLAAAQLPTQGACWPQLSYSREALAGRELLLQVVGVRCSIELLLAMDEGARGATGRIPCYC
ncbi:hypothetical protein Dimus_015360, partial [Dionaea muscipula]